MAHQQESFLPFSSWQSLSCYLSRMAKRSTPKPRGPLYSLSEPRGPLPFPSEARGSLYLLQNHVAPYLLQSCVVYSPFTLEPRGLLLPSELHGLLISMAAGPRFKSQHPSSFAAHFRLLLQSATSASIPVFFQLYWAAIVSLGRCGPMAWSQSSPSSPTSPVTRGNCFPVPSWVEFGPIPLAQSMATAT